MKKSQRMALVLGSALVLVGGASIASAATRTPELSPRSISWMEHMHDSPQMQAIRSQLPPDLQKACDQMHDAMVNGGYDGPPGSGGMMGGWNGSPGPGMMGRGGSYGSGMMGY